MRLATSAFVNAPKRVTTPAMNQMASSISGDPTCAAMTADFLKIPEPMTPPTTIRMVLNAPNVGTSPERSGGGDELRTAGRFGIGSEFNAREGKVSPSLHSIPNNGRSEKKQ